MNSYLTLIIFLVINFATLGIGGFLMDEGPTGSWYQNLNKAPWTPPGWVFGVAWTVIMICFSIFMAQLVKVNLSKYVISLFTIQLILNVIWNPLFFKMHEMSLALIAIILLSLVVGYFMIGFRKEIGNFSLLIAPYFLWLLIATSLNVYAVLHN